VQAATRCGARRKAAAAGIAIAVAPAVGGPQSVLRTPHLHVADVLPAPEGLKHAVAEPQDRQILNQLLACGQ
jgi:hypothetical protein